MNKFYDKAYNWIISFGPRIVLAILMLVIGFWLIRKFRKFISGHLLKKKIDPSIRPFLTGTLSIILQVLLIFAVMQILGIQLSIFAALVGAFGVAAGLALSGTLQNFTSGILILVLKPFRVGDNIVAQSIEGTVTTIRIFYTVVTTFDNRTVVFPNGKLSNEVIVNLSRQGNRRLDIEIKFNFDTAVGSIRPILEKVVSENTTILAEPKFRIGVSSFESDGYKVMINVWCNAHGFQDTKMQLQEALINALARAEIKMPS